MHDLGFAPVARLGLDVEPGVGRLGKRCSEFAQGSGPHHRRRLPSRGRCARRRADDDLDLLDGQARRRGDGARAPAGTCHALDGFALLLGFQEQEVMEATGRHVQWAAAMRFWM